MSTTEAVGGPCPRCEHDRCHIRYGTGTWYQFIACPECLFAFGMHADTMPTDNGIITGSDVWATIIEHPRYESFEDIAQVVNEIDSDRVESNTVFDFSDDDQLFFESCVASEQTVRTLLSK